MKKVLLFLFFTTATLSAAPPEHMERRAAFDIGSSRITIQVADVDLETNQIRQVLLTDSCAVKFREDLAKSPDGKLSKEIQDEAIVVMKKQLEKAAPFQPKTSHAVATEAFRLAGNSDAFVDRAQRETGIGVTIISQEDEGVLGFISAASEAHVDPSKAVSWDFGGGSFQITTLHGQDYLVYRGRIGKVPLKMTLLKLQGKEDVTLSPNPISEKEASLALAWIQDELKDLPEALRKKLEAEDTTVLSIGNNPLWGMSHSDHYDVRRIFKELYSRLDMSDEAIQSRDSLEKKEAATYLVSNLILAYGIMHFLNMREVHYVGTPGANTTALLLSPKYWRKSDDKTR